MRAYWILPNRDQSDDLSVSDGTVMMPLRQILDPTLSPAGFSHGVPAELLEKCGPNAIAEVLFAQRFPHWNGDKELFLLSSTAGVDSQGRVVYLGLLFILDPHERPQFDLQYGGLAKQDQAYASALLGRIRSSGPDDLWVQSVRDLIAMAPDRGPATNVALNRSVVRFDSLYIAGPDGPIRKAASWKLARTLVLIALLAMVLTGVVIWHFN